MFSCIFRSFCLTALDARQMFTHETTMVTDVSFWFLSYLKTERLEKSKINVGLRGILSQMPAGGRNVEITLRKFMITSLFLRRYFEFSFIFFHKYGNFEVKYFFVTLTSQFSYWKDFLGVSHDYYGFVNKLFHYTPKRWRLVLVWTIILYIDILIIATDSVLKLTFMSHSSTNDTSIPCSCVFMKKCL